MAGTRNKTTRGFTVLQNIMIVLLASLVLSALGWLYSYTLLPKYEASISFGLHRKSENQINIFKSEEIISGLFFEAKRLIEANPQTQTNDEVNGEFPILTLDQTQDVASLYAHGAEQTHLRRRTLSVLDTMEHVLEKENMQKVQQISSKLSALEKKIAELSVSSKAANRANLTQYNDANIIRRDDYLLKALIDTELRSAETNATIELIDKQPKDRISYLAIPWIANDADLRGLITERSLLAQRLAHLEAQLSQKSPQIKAMKSEFKNLDQQIDQKIALLVSEIYNRAIIEQNLVNVLTKKLSDFTPSATTNNILAPSDELLLLIKQRDEISAEKFELINSPLRIEILKPLAIVKCQHQFILYYVLWPFIFGLILFSAFLLMLNLFNKRRERGLATERSQTSFPHGPISLRCAVEAKTVSNLYSKIQEERPHRVAIFGDQAENLAARLAIELKNQGSTVILVDFSGVELSHYIGTSAGLTDIVFENATLENVIYQDINTGVDILSRGTATPKNDKDIGLQISRLMDQLEEKYSLVAIAVSEAPFAPLHTFLNSQTLLVVTNINESDEADLWVETLKLAGYKRIFTIKN